MPTVRQLVFVMLALLTSLKTPAVYSQTGLINITIDDSSADPLTGVKIVYGVENQAGHGDWVSVVDQNCTGCLAQPDAAQAFDHSWHDSSYSIEKGFFPFAWVTFTGSAVYVMGIVIASMERTSTSLNNTRLTFEIDGEDQGTYLHIASIGPETVFSYNTLVFAKDDLPYGFHNITILVGNSTPARDSLCLLDRIIYTRR
ncbi:hypothetical protein SCHPADRAFT_382079 [Schizopora paradoxa]|uniref:Uncharacterized protein n=1 Tax=Schizopora paradoxa TaxID=27342 RepID=A0A0H2S888_9AGAM|nr:hypothetical protein SCHPADRAFT_382079 [Schizopora paradoxa]